MLLDQDRAVTTTTWRASPRDVRRLGWYAGRGSAPVAAGPTRVRPAVTSRDEQDGDSRPRGRRPGRCVRRIRRGCSTIGWPSCPLSLDVSTDVDANPLWGEDWAEVRALWPLENTVAHLNHGSYGAVPTPVLEEQQSWRDRMESNPVRFFRRELPAALAAARAEVGDFLGADEGVARVRAQRHQRREHRAVCVPARRGRRRAR